MAKKKAVEKEPDWPEEGFYYHYKHDPKGDINNCAYQFVGVGRDEKTKKLEAEYLPLYERPGVDPREKWHRDLKDFVGMVEKDGREIPRFVKITDKVVIQRLIWLRNKMFDKAKGITLPPSRPD